MLLLFFYRMGLAFIKFDGAIVLPDWINMGIRLVSLKTCLLCNQKINNKITHFA